MTDTQKSWLEEAQDVTLNSRQQDYGHPLINFARVAGLWTPYLRSRGKLADGEYITPIEVAWLMVLFKVAREVNIPKRDNGVDAIGYISCLDRMNEYMKQLGYEKGMAAFDDMCEAEAIRLYERLELELS
jgi:hypothetical protein